MSEIEPAAPPPVRRSVSTKVIAAAVVLAAFVTGVLAGIVGDRLWMMRHGPPQMSTKFILNRLDHQLDLTDQQRTQIAAILERRHAQIRVILERTHPLVREEVEATNREIEALLTPEQRAKFEKLKMRFLMRRVGPPMHHERRERTESTR